jgi:hypothetical protein
MQNAYNSMLGIFDKIYFKIYLILLYQSLNLIEHNQTNLVYMRNMFSQFIAL